MLNALSGFAEVNGARLYYEMAGSGRPLVLVHGFALDTRMWNDQFQIFAQQYEVLRCDLRGFGKSSLPAEAYGHAADLKALMAHLDIQQADLIGLSLGGMVVVDFALSYPESVNHLVTVDGLFGGFHWSTEWDTRTGLVWEIAREKGTPAAKESWLDHPMFQPIREKPEKAARLNQMVADYSGWHFVHEDPRMSLKPPAVLRLNQINVPTLVILGERDLPDFHHMADEMARQIPNARKTVLPNVGHMSNMEDPDGFNKSVLAFLAGA
jgi:pimeloyl-ACP methyl ester carboxylesterase